MYIILYLVLYTAHHKDKKRIDITIPGERYIYLRMSTQAEKQKWLVALGCAKQDSGKTGR